MGDGEKKKEKEEDITQTESNEGIVGSADNLDRDRHQKLSCSCAELKVFLLLVFDPTEMPYSCQKKGDPTGTQCYQHDVTLSLYSHSSSLPQNQFFFLLYFDVATPPKV
ncbi:hypothetical protein NQZ68_016061 [Dissostichus eleginoides]|nr:hypothetical protein NQZ68_016061 [Dissostichus eleginoides]